MSYYLLYKYKYIKMINHSTLSFKNVIKSDFLNDKLFNLATETFTIPESYNYSVVDVTKEYIARPDLISLDAYGDPNFADVICKLNGVSNPFELNEGMKLIIPTIEDITNFTHQPEASDNEYLNTNTPTAKRKNEKRKANEAVVGDSRFKIDTKKGIIIY